ncbi:MAG TPA: peptidylprolyl isomerase [Candidatus Angelobacter sp.]|jgi:hypothetical protein|nr:peptidylprolyl isomerase [Candidatus Angelobacter sp.]
MRFSRIVILFGGVSFSLFANAQTPAKTPEVGTPASNVAATQPVITVRGLCAYRNQGKTTDAAGCTSTINREQFEALVNALNPEGVPLPPNGRQNLARSYAEYLAIEAAAKDLGLEDTIQFRELMEWQRLKTITDLYKRKIQEKYRTPSQEEITAYYKEHIPDYESLKLARVLIPREGLPGQDKEAFDKKAHELAIVARQRMMKGEDPAQVQNDAYSALEVSSLSSTDLGNRRRNDLVKDQANELFSLNAGDVSQVEIEARSYVIYKVISKDVKPEDQVKNDISREIYQKKFREAMKAVIDAAAPAEFNDQYFGPAAQAASPGQPGSPVREK